MKRHDDPWSIDEWAFPEPGCARAKLEFIVRYAILAPSTHNTQPWLFHVHDETLEVFADRRRGLPVVDPHGRELTISCGAAIEIARIALQHYGYMGHIEPLPDPSRPELLARLRLGATAPPSSENELLFAAITRRRTTRLAFRPFASEALVQEVTALARLHRVEASVVDSEAHRRCIAGLIARADRVQMADPAFRRELAAWLRPSMVSSDGMSLSSFGAPDLLTAPGALAMRTFNMGEVVAGRDDELVACSPCLMLLATADDTALDWTNTGRALAMMTLRATADGICSSYLNQPIEVPELRPALGEAMDIRGAPQILLRLGRAAEVPSSPRRPAYQVLVE